jgi:hypothetical protein
LALVGTAAANAGPYSWFIVIYTLAMILSVGYCVGGNVLPHYRFALLTCLAVNIMLAINGANSFIYGLNASTSLVGAGFVLVACVEVREIIL